MEKTEEEYLRKVFFLSTPLEKKMYVKHISRRNGLKLSSWIRKQLYQALDEDLKEIISKGEL